MKFNNLIISIFLSLLVFRINTISLISKYQTQESKISEIISNLGKAVNDWKFEKFSISKQTKSIDTQHSYEELSIDNFNYIGSFLTTNKLQGILNINEENVKNSLEITPTKEDESVYGLTIEFSYAYSNDFKNKTVQESNGKGEIILGCNRFNYTVEFSLSNYEILNLVDINLSLVDIVSDQDAQGRVPQMLKQALDEGLMDIISANISQEMVSSLDAFESQKENEKIFALTRREPEKVFNISYRHSLGYVFDLIGVINFMEGSIEGEKILSGEDTSIEAFKDFDFEMQTDQLFIHKKLLINLFKLGLERQLVTVTTDVTKQLKLKGFNEMSMKALSRFYPQVLNFKPIDTEFYIEYYVNSVTYVNNNALVNYSFFFVAEDEEVLVKFNCDYNFVFELIDETSEETGKRSLNLVIRDSANLVQRDFKLLSPEVSKVDVRKLSLFVNDLLAASYRNKNYVLLKDFEDFGKLIEKFDSIKLLDDGLILYQKLNSNEGNLKFLFNY